MDIKIKLPKSQESIKNFYENCEKRKKFVVSDKESYKKHLKKGYCQDNML